MFAKKKEELGLPDDVELPDDIDPQYIDQILDEMKKNEESGKFDIVMP